MRREELFRKIDDCMLNKGEKTIKQSHDDAPWISGSYYVVNQN